MFEFLLFYSSSFSFRSLLLARRRIPHSIRSQTIRKQWKWLYSDIRDPTNSFFISLSLFALWVCVWLQFVWKEDRKETIGFGFDYEKSVRRLTLSPFDVWYFHSMDAPYGKVRTAQYLGWFIRFLSFFEIEYKFSYFFLEKRIFEEKIKQKEKKKKKRR